MTVDQLATLALESLSHKSPVAIQHDPVVQILMPRRMHYARTRYLSGRNSPLGQLLTDNGEGEIVNFDAMEILLFCVANGTTIDVSFVNKDGSVYRHGQTGDEQSPLFVDDHSE